MFDIGFWELIIISVVALLVMGPEKLPGLLRDISKWSRMIRQFVTETRNDLERQIIVNTDDELTQRISELDELVKNAPDKIKDSLDPEKDA